MLGRKHEEFGKKNDQTQNLCTPLQRLGTISLPALMSQHINNDKQYDRTISLSMHELRRSVSGQMSKNIYQPREISSDISANMMTPEGLPTKTGSSSGFVYKEPFKRRTFCCIIELAGVSFVILLLTLLTVLLLVPPPQHLRYPNTGQTRNLSAQVRQSSSSFSKVSTKFKAPATDLQMKKQYALEQSREEITRHNNHSGD